VLVGSVVLTKRLIDGTIEAWDAEKNEFGVVETLGRVRPGEVVSIKYLGDREGARYNYPDFKVIRKPAVTGGAVHDEPEADEPSDDDVPF
jgi:hypothetical protein